MPSRSSSRHCAELGIDASDHGPHELDDDDVAWADVVIAACDGACPVVPGKRYENWELPDPYASPSRTSASDPRRIARRVATLVAELARDHRRTAGEQRRPPPALDARPLPAALDRARDGGGPRPRRADPAPERRARASLQVGTVSLPIAVGLLLMMYPVLAKVRYEELGHLRGDRKLFGISLFLSWVVGPALMFALAWAFLADQPAYRTGVIIVGLARCIAMVLIWNDIACGDRDRAAVLVVFNAIFQVVAYSLLGYFYLTVLPGWLGLDTQGFEVGIWEVARTVLIFLGIPLAAGFATRRIGIRRRGRDWYESRFIPRIAPITLYGLLFTIVAAVRDPGRRDHRRAARRRPDRAAAPRSTSRSCGSIGFGVGKPIGLPYPQTATLAFTVACNDFELAIAVAVGVFGATSGEALAGVVGPLIEVPVLVGLVYVALWARRFFVERSPATLVT